MNINRRKRGEEMKALIVWVCIIGVLAFTLGQSTMIADWIEEKYVDVDPEPEDAPKVLYQTGKYCYFLSNHDRAMQNFQRVLKEYEESHWAAASLFMSGKIHEKKGALLQAKIAFRQMEKDYPYETEYVEKANLKLKELERGF